MQKDNEEQKPEYIHRFPFRFVRPYPYTYKTFTKGRWIGKELLATLVKQFKAYPPEYYENAIATAKITVNRKQVPHNYILKNGDEITHISLRVEPPVLDLPIDIVNQCEQFLVVNKPASIIVHTGGGHHYNTIQNLLKYEYGFKNINVLHRLDKCTSGLLLFSKNKKNVAIFHEESGKETMKKMYYARVNGNFSWEHKQLSAYIECVSHKDGVYRVTGQIEQNKLQKSQTQIKEGQQVQKILVYNEKKQKLDLKDSKTIFQKVWYDEATDSSLLQCYPITGRTHQIRVHLQYLGFPILNDVVYGGRFVGNNIIRFIKNKEEQKEEEIEPKKKVKLNEEIDVESWDYQTKPWQIMLHSYKYKFAGKQFKSQVPYWFYRQAIKPLKGQ